MNAILLLRLVMGEFHDDALVKLTAESRLNALGCWNNNTEIIFRRTLTTHF